MKSFMDREFLLETETARMLYHECAEELPIIDYHCHINPKEIAEDRTFSTITQVWLGGDHYKWRLMRAGGVSEELVTGKGDDREKFRAYAALMPKLIGNPLYHWSHLELQRYFGIYEPLCAKNADRIYSICNEKLRKTSARRLIEQSDVRAICTTDDPCDSLEWHDVIAADPSFSCKVLPTFRPDKAIQIEKAGFAEYIKKLEGVAGRGLDTVAGLIDVLQSRVAYFAAHGCLCADHGFDRLTFEKPDPVQAQSAYAKALTGEHPTADQVGAFKTLVMIAMANCYAEYGWVMQIHFGCLRDNNRIQFRALGPDTGYDAVNADSGVENLGKLLNVITECGALPKMVLYSLSPTDNTAIETVMACFQDGSMAGKLQHGAAWWFNDTKSGICHHLTDLAANGVLGEFIGMLTDSRSFLSYARHEYFRRILCNLIGSWVENGEYPNDKESLHTLIADICVHNVNRYFLFGLQLK